MTVEIKAWEPKQYVVDEDNVSLYTYGVKQKNVAVAILVNVIGFAILVNLCFNKNYYEDQYAKCQNDGGYCYNQKSDVDQMTDWIVRLFVVGIFANLGIFGAICDRNGRVSKITSPESIAKFTDRLKKYTPSALARKYHAELQLYQDVKLLPAEFFENLNQFIETDIKLSAKMLKLDQKRKDTSNDEKCHKLDQKINAKRQGYDTFLLNWKSFQGSLNIEQVKKTV